MKKNIFVSLTTALSIAVAIAYQMKDEPMNTIHIDIGENINETAKKSGAPKYSVESHWGATFYELLDIPQDITVKYDRPGYEVMLRPLFSLTMFADANINKSLMVEQVALQFSSNAAQTHEDARSLIDELIGQFRKGKWRRHIVPTCPAVSGRSAYLDVSGKLEGDCPLDPGYRIPDEDWLKLMRMPQSFEWFGDGVVARLKIKFDAEASRVRYSIDLAFQDLAIEQKRNFSKQAQDLADGDAKGWKSTDRFNKSAAENKVKISLLEANAVARGDQLVSRE